MAKSSTKMLFLDSDLRSMVSDIVHPSNAPKHILQSEIWTLVQLANAFKTFSAQKRIFTVIRFLIDRRVFSFQSIVPLLHN